MKGKNKLENVAIRMVEAPPLYSEEVIQNPEDVISVLGRELATYDREVVCVVNLRTNLSPINMNIVSMGTVSASLMSTREVFKSSILSNAAGIMIVHNHPGGSLCPSPLDIEMTGKVEKAAEFMDIPLVDHIITGVKGEYFSFRKSGMLGQEAGKAPAVAEGKRSIRKAIARYQEGQKDPEGGHGKEAAQNKKKENRGQPGR